MKKEKWFPDFHIILVSNLVPRAIQLLDPGNEVVWSVEKRKLRTELCSEFAVQIKY